MINDNQSNSTSFNGWWNVTQGTGMPLAVLVVGGRFAGTTGSPEWWAGGMFGQLAAPVFFQWKDWGWVVERN